MVTKRKLLGQILLEEGVINKKQLEQAAQEQKRTGNRIGSIFVKSGFVSEEKISESLAKQLNLSFVKLSKIEEIPQEVINKVSEDFARNHKLIPIGKKRNTLIISMSDPLNVFAIDELERKTELRIESVVSTSKEIEECINRYYGKLDVLSEAVKDVEEGQAAGVTEEVSKDVELEEAEEDEDVATMERMAQRAPIVNLVNTIIKEAVKERASDIHIEPERDRVRTRYRVDGILHESGSLSKGTELAVVSRIKIMSGLDIAEKRVPQDGRIRAKVENRSVDMRVSSLPTLHGEKIVMRIMDPEAVIVELKQLGMSDYQKGKFETLIKHPHGIVLVTGPTGCGKSSTLYAALNYLNSAEKNIVTIEDPVEFPIRGINQVQINPKAGLTFAGGLRAFLRQDPNIIMVGEIRDLETAEIAIHAALTGHLVFSTLHTNDAPSAIARFIDMGVEPFLVSSSLVGVAAQRLVRVICENCKEKHAPSKSALEGFRLSQKGDVMFYHGKGCLSCRGTGFVGRTGMFELMMINEEIRRLILSNVPSSQVRKAAIESGMKSLREDGMEKVLEGVTTLEEVLRVTQEEEYEKEKEVLEEKK